MTDDFPRGSAAIDSGKGSSGKKRSRSSASKATEEDNADRVWLPGYGYVDPQGDDLFGDPTASTGDAGKAKRSKKEGGGIFECPRLTSSRLTEGTAVLGVVRKVKARNVVVALANHSTAFIDQMDDVSDFEWSANSKPPKCSRLFRIGDLVVGTIRTVERTKDGHKRPLMSLRSSLVNQYWRMDHIRQNTVVSAYVQSVEDHGYVLRFGTEASLEAADGDLLTSQRGFLPADESSRRNLKWSIGQPVVVAVKDANRDAKLVTLQTVDEAHKAVAGRWDAPPALPDHNLGRDAEVSYNQLKCGLLLPATIEAVTSTGYWVRLPGGFRGSLDFTHCTSGEWDCNRPGEEGALLTRGDAVWTRTMWVHFRSRVVGVSALPAIVNWKTPLPLPVIEGTVNTTNSESAPSNKGAKPMIGSKVELRVVHCEPEVGILLREQPDEDSEDVEMAEHRSSESREAPRLYFAHVSQLSKTKLSAGEVAKKFKVGADHEGRVLGHSYLDGQISVTLNAEDVNAAVVTYADVRPGQTIQCVVGPTTKSDVIVYVGDEVVAFAQSQKKKSKKSKSEFKVPRDMRHLTGVIRSTHVSETGASTANTALDQPGRVITCRVLSVFPQSRRLWLTYQRTLIKSELPALTSYEVAASSLGKYSHGTVLHIKKNYLVVSFYQDVVGVVTRDQLLLSSHDEDLADLYRIGQPLRLCIHEVDVGRKRIKLSMSKRIEGEGPATTDRGSESRGVNGATVTRIDNERFFVRAGTPSTTYILPFSHLSDSPTLSEKLGEKHNQASTKRLAARLTILGDVARSRYPLLTMKRALGSHVLTPSAIGDVKEGDVYFGYVQNISTVGVFVAFAGGVVALMPRSLLAPGIGTDAFQQLLKQRFQVGQTLRVRCVQVDRENGKLVVRPAAADPVPRLGFSYYLAAWMDAAALAAIETDESTPKPTPYAIGQRLRSLKVGTVKDYGCIVYLPDGLVGFIKSENIEDPETTKKEGAKISAVVLDIDAEKRIIDLSTRADLLKGRKSDTVTPDWDLDFYRLNAEHQKLQTPVDARVELVKEDRVVVSLPVGKGGKLGSETAHRSLLIASTADYNQHIDRVHETVTIGTNLSVCPVFTTPDFSDAQKSSIESLWSPHFLRALHTATLQRFCVEEDSLVSTSGTAAAGNRRRRKDSVQALPFSQHDLQATDMEVGRCLKGQIIGPKALADPTTSVSANGGHGDVARLACHYLTVRLSGTLIGRIHISNVTDHVDGPAAVAANNVKNPFADYSIGDVVDCCVLNVHEEERVVRKSAPISNSDDDEDADDDDVESDAESSADEADSDSEEEASAPETKTVTIVELSVRPDHLTRANQGQAPTTSDEQLTWATMQRGLRVRGVVTQAASEYLLVDVAPGVRARLHFLDCFSPLELEGDAPQWTAPAWWQCGARVEVYVASVDADAERCNLCTYEPLSFPELSDAQGKAAQGGEGERLPIVSNVRLGVCIVRSYNEGNANQPLNVTVSGSSSADGHGGHRRCGLSSLVFSPQDARRDESITAFTWLKKRYPLGAILPCVLANEGHAVHSVIPSPKFRPSHYIFHSVSVSAADAFRHLHSAGTGDDADQLLLSPGSRAFGTVKSVDRNGLFAWLPQYALIPVRIGSDGSGSKSASGGDEEGADVYVATMRHAAVGRALIANCSDRFIPLDQLQAHFPAGRVVRCVITSAPDNRGRYSISLRESDVLGQDNVQYTREALPVGETMLGTVKKVERFGLFVRLHNTLLDGLCHISEIDAGSVRLDEEILKKRYRIGQTVVVKVVANDVEKKRISLSLKQVSADEKLQALEAADNREDDDSEASGGESDATSDEEMDDIGSDDDDDEGFDLNLNASNFLDNDGDSDVSDSSDDDDDEFGLNLQSAGASGAGFDFGARVKAKAKAAAEDGSDDDSDSESDADDDGGDSKRKKRDEGRVSGREKRREAQMQEELLQRHEREGVVGVDRAPETADDYERLLMGSPNSSYLWIQYCAFHLSLANVEKARDVCERALKSIDYREEEEKFNVWTALMNLERQFGDSESLSAVVRRATQFCDEKRVLLQLAGIHERASAFSDALSAFKQCLRKHKQSCKVWTQYAQFLLLHRSDVVAAVQNTGEKDGDEDTHVDDIKQVILRACAALAKRKHVKFLSACARMEFKSGSTERGRTLFEGLVSNYPKRADVWSQFIDMELHHGNREDVESGIHIARVRRIYQRLITIKLSFHKMRSIFKRFLLFERKNGTAEDVDEVKRLAKEYVEQHAA